MNRKASTLTRRTFVGGTTATIALGVTGGLFSTKTSHAGTSANQLARHAPHDLFAHHCRLVHKAMGEKLTAIVADPQISDQETSLALRTTFCPCCKTRISARYPASSGEGLFVTDNGTAITKVNYHATT